MVKAYLRYEGETAIGVISSRECNAIFDRTGSLVLTGCVDVVGVWNLRQSTQVRTLKTAKSAERVTRLCLKGGDQPVCAVGYSDGTVRLWNYEEAVLMQTLQGHRSGVSCLAFDRKSHLLASGANDTDIVLWDVISESGVARLRGHIDQVTDLIFWDGADHRDADAENAAEDAVAPRLISASKDRFIRIWSIELQLCLQTIAEHQTEVWTLSLNLAQNRLAAGSSDKFLRVWTLHAQASGSEEEPLATFLGAVPRENGQGSALSVQFVKPKQVDFEVLLCQGSGRTVEMFRCHDEGEIKRRLKRRKKRVEVKKVKKAANAVGSLLPSKEEDEEEPELETGDQTAEGGPSAADELTSIGTHRCAAKALSLAWNPASSVALMALTNNALESVKLKKGEEQDTVLAESAFGIDVPGHRTAVRALAVAHDDSLLMSLSAECVKIWNTTTGRCVRTMPSGYGMCGFFVAGNEHVLIGTKEGRIELYDLRVGELTQTLEPHTGAVYGLAERPDHTGFVSCSADRSLRFFALTFPTGAAETCNISEIEDKVTPELPDEALAVGYSPNGKWVAVALLNSTVQLIFEDTLKFYISLYGHRLPVMSIDFSSDSQIIASGSADKNVKLWSTQFGNCHRSLRAHNDSVMQVRFLPGTHYLASVGRDREMKLWDCDTYELITAFQGHGGEILALALAQDAAFIVTAGADRQIRFWRRSQEQLFLSEERAKEMDDKFEKEVERDDLQAPGVSEVVTLRASRRTVESVRTTERLMEILDEAVAEGNTPVSTPGAGMTHPCARVVAYVNTLTASNIYEVLLALPFSHAIKLLQFVCTFFEAVSALPSGKTKADTDVDGDAQTRVLSAATTLETPCQAALIATYIHHSELAATPSARALILRLRQQMRALLQTEKDRIGLSIAGFAHLHRTLKRSSGLPGLPAVSKATAAVSEDKRPKKKRRK